MDSSERLVGTTGSPSYRMPLASSSGITDDRQR